MLIDRSIAKVNHEVIQQVEIYVRNDHLSLVDRSFSHDPISCEKIVGWSENSRLSVMRGHARDRWQISHVAISAM